MKEKRDGMLMGTEGKDYVIGAITGRVLVKPHREVRAEAIPSNIDLRWHVLLADPNSEFKARHHLDESGFEPYVPSETVVSYRTSHTLLGTVRRKVETTRPIFRGYVFVRLNLAWSFGSIYQTPGLRQNGHPFLIQDGRHAVLPDIEIEKLKKIEHARLYPDKPILPYKVGDKVRVVEGPFMDMVMRVGRLDDVKRIELMMDILGGRDVKFFVEAFQIVPVN